MKVEGEKRWKILSHASANNYQINKTRALCDLIDAQPTGYDVGKVVERLEKEKNPLYREDGSLMGERAVIGIDKAIEIVKDGGVDVD